MEFCVADVQELELEKNLFHDSFFDRNMITFIDPIIFEQNYLTSYEYNDPVIQKIGTFTLQPRGYIVGSFCPEVKAANLR